MKNWLVILCLLLSSPVMADEYQTLEWDNLLTDEELANPPPPPPPEPDSWAMQDPSLSDPMANSPMFEDAMPPQESAPVRDDLDGRKVKLAGFVVPLEGNEKVITEFLLVPYFGACIHVPPPPTNQVAYVKFPKGAPVADLWDAIWVYGSIRAESKTAEGNTAGYSIEADKIEVYQY